MTGGGGVVLEIFEDGVPPRFRLRQTMGGALQAPAIKIETVRPDGAWQRFTMVDRGGYMESKRKFLSRTLSRRICGSAARVTRSIL